MKRDYNTLFKGIYKNDLDTSLFEDKLLKSTHKKLGRFFFMQKISFAGLSVLSLSSLVYVIILGSNHLALSGAFQYISLAFYDTQVLTYWKEFILSLAETLPFTELALSLIFVSVLFWSVQKIFITNNLKTINI